MVDSYAGFSAGGKIVLPGLASWETVLANHKPASRVLSGAVAQVEGNTRREEIDEAARLAGLDEFLSSSWGIPVELVKPFLMDESRGVEERRPRIAVLIHALDEGLRMLHPFMPFLTEEIWQRLPHEGESIMIRDFPAARPGRRDLEATAAMDRLMELVAAMRSARSGMNIPDRRQLDAYLIPTDAGARQLVDDNLEKIQTLARLGAVAFVSEFPAGQFLLKGVSRSADFGLDLGHYQSVRTTGHANPRE